MIKFIIVFALILSLGGVAFAQEVQPPGGPAVNPGAVQQGAAPQQGAAIGGGRTIVDILRAAFPQVTIEVNPVTGTLIVKAPPSIQKKIGEMIKRLDVYHPQITIEAKFVELTVGDINELGVEMQTLAQGQYLGGQGGIKVGNTFSEGNVNIKNSWADTDAGFPAEAAGTSFWFTRLSDTAFNAVLRALEKQKKVNVLSAPRVTTVNGQPANIEINQNIPYVSDRTITNVGTSQDPIWQTNYTIKEKSAGVSLEVTPTVPEGSTLITLDIKPKVQVLVRRIITFSGVESAYGWPVIDTRTANTSMVVRSGDSIVLGGLIQGKTSVITKKVPLLGDIPLLGYAFRYKHSQNVKKNLLIFITAYLVSPSGGKIVGGASR